MGITLRKIIDFFIVKIIIGIIVVIAAVAFTELFVGMPLNITSLSENAKHIIVALADAAIALLSYGVLFGAYEKRKILELSSAGFFRNASIGFSLGLALHSAFILIIFLAGGYSVTAVNPASYMIPSMAAAITAGFVAEILIRGICFRLIEEKLGTVLTLVIAVAFFAFMHARKDGANFLNVSATAAEAGFLLSASYVYSRSLWLPIFLHFAWDFAEPGLFGAINPGNTISTSLLSSEIRGSSLLTGASLGPQNSIQSLILCSLAGIIFLWQAKKKNKFIMPFWKKVKPS